MSNIVPGPRVPILTRPDVALSATEVARALRQLCTLGVLSPGGLGRRPASALEVVHDALALTESGALAGYGASDTRFALDLWRLVLHLLQGPPDGLAALDNRELAAFLDKIRKAAFGAQVSSALARWLSPRIFISPQYTLHYLDTVRPPRDRRLPGS